LPLDQFSKPAISAIGLGTHVDLSHLAATPIGREVTATVRLIAFDGRCLRFEVECRDETDVVRRGLHQRTIINKAKFMERLARKISPVSKPWEPGSSSPQIQMKQDQ
jgi:predicted thioesterase